MIGADAELLLTFGSYQAAEEFYNNFDLGENDMPRGTTIKRLYV